MGRVPGTQAPRHLLTAATGSVVVLAVMSSASLELARRVAEEPGALPALIAAMAAGGAAAAAPDPDVLSNSSVFVIANIASADTELA